MFPASDGTGAVMRHVGFLERQVRRADRFQQRHRVIAFPWAVVQKFGNDEAGSKAALMAYYGLFALFPLLLLLATVLGFALSDNPALREQLIDSALGNFPVIGEQLRSTVHPLEGNTTALVIGIVGTVYGSLAVLASTALATFATAVAHGVATSVLSVAGSVLVNLGLFLLAFMVLTAEPLRPREVAVGAI